MAKRKFKLPGEEDLNKDQDKILELPEDGQFLIVGGPGTGKSVVALLRTLQYLKNNNYIFLTYNKVLQSSTMQLVDIALESKTLTSLIYKAYWKQFKKKPPEIKKFKPNYEQIIKDFEKLNRKPISLHLIIDEGQDMPVQFYEALMYLGIENFFIVADQNQQITEDNSSKQELTNLLGLDVGDVIELKENYRNSHPIGLFSNSFFTDPSSPAPNLPSKSKISLGVPILYEYTNYQDCAKLILREYDRDSRNLIGVIVAKDDMRDSYYQTLQTLELQIDNDKPIISTYSNCSNKKEHNSIDFSNSGIVVLNDKSVKGLEFDIVYIVIDGFNIYNNDIDSMKKRFYVMSSRAIKKLVLLKSKDYKGGVDNILPNDDNIFKREVL